MSQLGRDNDDPRIFAYDVKRYDDSHRAERRRVAAAMEEKGYGTCMETICVMPRRRIELGQKWHLAHDHEKGGRHDYLGPAHPQCNITEALARGVTWSGPLGDIPPAGNYATCAECSLPLFSDGRCCGGCDD